MANSKSAPSKPRRKTGSPGKSRPSSRSTRSTSRPSAPKAATGTTVADQIKSTGSPTAKRAGQVAGTAKEAAARAKGPALAAGAAAAGIAVARALKGRMGRKTVLGVPIPTSLASASLPDLDVRSIAKTIGEASQRFAETSRAVSKDLERVGDQAERIGRMLG